MFVCLGVCLLVCLCVYLILLFHSFWLQCDYNLQPQCIQPLLHQQIQLCAATGPPHSLHFGPVTQLHRVMDLLFQCLELELDLHTHSSRTWTYAGQNKMNGLHHCSHC